MQGLLGADIQMQLDVCPPGTRRAPVVEAAVRADHAVGASARSRSRARRGQALFGIVQGGVLRRPAARPRRRARRRSSRLRRPRPRRLLGRRAHRSGCTRPWARSRLALDPERPRYLMGVGTPRDLLSPSARASTCSTACCRRATRATGRPSRARGASSSRRRATRTTRAPSTNAAPALLRRADTRAPTCGTCTSRARSSCLRLLSLHNLHVYGELVAGARRAISRAAMPPTSAPGWRACRRRRVTRSADNGPRQSRVICTSSAPQVVFRPSDAKSTTKRGRSGKILLQREARLPAASSTSALRDAEAPGAHATPLASRLDARRGV